MKITLLMKNILKENYKYFMTISILYGFLAVLYHITAIPEGVHLFCYGLSIVNALLLPNIIFKNYYHQTNVNHLASIPFKRHELFLSGYLVAICYSISLILAFSSLTILVKEATMFVGYTSALLVGSLYYLHLSLLAFWLCGQVMFQSIVLVVMIFGPVLFFLVYQWAMETYDLTYVSCVTFDTMMKLLPFLGCGAHFLEIDPTPYYSLFLNEMTALLLVILFVVKIRPYEYTGQSIVFEKFSYVIRSGVSILAISSCYAFFGILLGSGDYFQQMMTCIISGLMVCYLVEGIYKKKAKVLYSLKYGVLAGILVFAAVHLGVKAVDDYIPGSYETVVLSGHDYYQGDLGEASYQDKTLQKSVNDLHEAMMDYYEKNEKEILKNELIGYICVEYTKNNGETFYAREYRYTEAMKREVLEDEQFFHLLYLNITHQEQKILSYVQEKKPINFIVNQETYCLDTESEFYQFEKHLLNELNAIYTNEKSVFDILEKGAMYVDWSIDETNYSYTQSSLIYNALAKTFGF